ncbi:MAG TPA: cobalt ECF transporter T component CbiQ [Methanomicrobiales archaeon]|jgi:cobalt/nickel transport system permease protein|nr:cobalt ECF transporter T component CbiQ [Methanomicrobiales archaeon]
MIEDLFFLERQAYRDSLLHRLDARVKILACFAAIIAIVAVPYSAAVYTAGIFLFLLFALLWALSEVSPAVYAMRLAVIVPLWGIVILFQVFITNPYYTEFHPVAFLPFGLAIYAESLQFASILAVKFLVSVSFIILLSVTTTLQDLLQGAGRLGLPAEFALALGMMIRYLFVFGYIFRKVNEALATRCFHPFDRKLPYRYRLQQLGNAIGTLFLRSYEQGERVFVSMLCRGYGKHSHLFIEKKPFGRPDWAFLSFSLTWTAVALLIGLTAA